MEEGMTTAAIEPATPTIEAQTEAPVIKDEPIDLDAPDEPTEAKAEDGEEGSTQEGDEPAADEGEGEQSTEEPGFVDIEIDGKQYQVPAELKDGYLRQADYTRKTQETAEIKRHAEAIKAEAEAALNVSQEVLEARAFKLNLDGQLKQFQEVNWDQLEAEDPIGAQSAWRRFQQLQQQAEKVNGYLNTQQAQRAEQVERETANRLRETAEFASKSIPGWTTEMDAKIVTFVQDLGIPREQIVQAINPTIYKMMHLAYLGSQSLAKQQTAPRPAAPTQPLRTVSAKASPSVSKDPENMSMEEYAAFRKSQKRNF